MTTWRTIITDSESLSGVAPVCPHQNDPAKHATDFSTRHDGWVYDCCPHPHIECYDERRAAEIARALTEAEAELCT